METTPLRQFLQSLCHDSCWNYAVFWNLQHQNEMLLTWEDGFYDCPKLRGSLESILNDIHGNESDEIFSCNWESSRHDGNSGECPIGLAVADMTSVQYPWGEGVVGKVAYTGNHCWILTDNISAGEFVSEVVPECPDEWLLQFAAGVKTILLVPVVPHGVLQLGSLKKVAEYPALVAYIKDKFNAYQSGMDLFPFVSRESVVQASSHMPIVVDNLDESQMPIVVDNLDESSTTIVNKLNSEDPKAVCSVKPTNNELSTTNQMMPVCPVQDACHVSWKDVLDIPNGTGESEISVHSIGLIRVWKLLNENDRESEMTDGSMVEVSSLEEELQASYCSDVGIFGEHAKAIMNSYSDPGMMEQQFVDKDPDIRGHENVNTFSSFPMDCELHKALGPAFSGQTKEQLWDSSLSGEDAFSNQIFNRDLINGIEPSIRETSACLAKRDEAEHLLEAVLDSLCGGLNDYSSNKPNDFNLSVTSGRQFTASNKALGQSEESAFVEEQRGPWSTVTCAFGARGQNALIESSPLFSSLESMKSMLIEEQEQKKLHGYLQTRKASKVPNTGKRRARPGENLRPRPRDRQLIQDRVRELRKLVPNGSKCSIDGLLDRTIKHMLFLRSFTDQAEKLKRWVNQEGTAKKNMKSSGTKRDRQSGKSWAFELGSDLHVCPLVVEDLEYPGHMLIEMLCNDHGLFLEITEVVRHLDLTILKGAMESHSNNMWAHFIVEAPRGFHRLDIFWPLMQLLQCKEYPISSRT